MHAAFLASTDMWLQSQAPSPLAMSPPNPIRSMTTARDSSPMLTMAASTALPDLPSASTHSIDNRTNRNDNALLQILPPSPDRSYDGTFVDVNSSMETTDESLLNPSLVGGTPDGILQRLEQVKQVSVEERLGLTGSDGDDKSESTSDNPMQLFREILGDGGDQTNETTNGGDDDAINSVEEKEPHHDAQNAPVDSSIEEPSTPEEKKAMRNQLEIELRSELLQQELKLLLEETQVVMGANLSLVIVTAICQAAYMITYTHKYFDSTVDDMVYYPTVMGTLIDDEESLVLVKHIDRCYACLQDEKMIPAELITTLVIVAARLHHVSAIDASQRKTMSMPIELTQSALEDFVNVRIEPMQVNGVNKNDAKKATSHNTVRLSKEERAERRRRIFDQMKGFLDEVKTELEFEIPEMPSTILHKAAQKVTELVRYQDQETGDSMFFPTVHDAIMDDSLTVKANELYRLKTGKEDDEVPVEYTSLLRVVAARKLQDDDTKYGQSSLKEMERQAVQLSVKSEDEDSQPDSNGPKEEAGVVDVGIAQDSIQEQRDESPPSPPAIEKKSTSVNLQNFIENSREGTSPFKTVVKASNRSQVSYDVSEMTMSTKTLETVLMPQPAPNVTHTSNVKTSDKTTAKMAQAQYDHFANQTKSSAWTVAKVVNDDADRNDVSSMKNSPRDVYIKDRTFAWLPAKVLQFEADGAIVNIIETEDWEDTTINSEQLFKNSLARHTSLKHKSDEEIREIMQANGIRNACSLRKVLFADYCDGEFPQQNSLVGNDEKSDLADLLHLHEASILYNLKERHFRSKPYTRVGDIVIAMNPFTWINQLYSSDTRDEYAKHYIWDYREGDDGSTITGFSDRVVMDDKLGADPHVYEVSSSAYRGLATGGQDQTILVTGESGAGKTETVKIVITHLATVQETRPEGVETDHVTAQEIISRVCKSSPIFEAFGNAKTARNDNSSRFGKFIQLQFVLEPEDASINAGRVIPYTDLVGSKCTTYLLEKSRVVHHAETERSYHIFYQLLAAPTNVKRAYFDGFENMTVEDFAFLAGGGAGGANFDDDEESWHATCAALKLFKMDGEHLTELMQALIIVLQLGNLRFDEEEAVGTIISSKVELEAISKMTGLAPMELEASLTSKLLRTPGGSDDIYVKMSVEASQEARDALAKDVYAAVFHSIVESMNEFTSFDEDSLTGGQSVGHISLLDIFGFENFSVNRFEQFCINYANEKLHNKYVHDNFDMVKEEYEEQGIDLYDFALVDNSSVLELLEGKGGLISSLNEECLRPQGTAENFVLKNKTHHKDSKRLIDRKLHQKTEFGVLHFASPVEYDAAGFLERNMDRISDDLAACAAKMKNRFIRTEFERLLAGRSKDVTEAISPNKKRARSYVVEKFREQLHVLMDAMMGSRTRYIRCIKPNSEMIPKLLDHNTTMYQLQCSGLITAIQISRESFPSSLSYGFILSRYTMLIDDEESQDAVLAAQGVSDDEDAATAMREQVKRLLASWLLPLAKRNRDGSCTLPFACGRTKVFFKPGGQERLEYLRRTYFGKFASVIQKHARRQTAVRSFQLKKRNALALQSFGRMVIARQRLLTSCVAVTTLTAWYRGAVASSSYRESKNAAIQIQSVLRGCAGREVATCIRMQNAATSLACWMRCNTAVQITNGLRRERAATKLQSLARRRSAIIESRARSTFVQRENAAIKIQSVARVLPARLNYGKSLYAVDVLQRAVRHMQQMGILKRNLSALASKARANNKLAMIQSDMEAAKKAGEDANAALESRNAMLLEMEELMRNMADEMEALRERNQELENTVEVKEQVNRELASRLEKSEAGALKTRSRVAELQKINESLAKKVFEFKGENTQMRRSYQNKNMQLNHKLTVAEKKLETIEAARDAQVAGLKDDLKEQQKVAAQESAALRQEKDLVETRRQTDMAKAAKELKDTQESHHAYLKQIMEVLEKTQTAREEEAKRINEELKNIRKKKNDQIVALHHDIQRLKSQQEAPPVSQERVDLIRSKFETEAESRRRRSAQVDDVVQDLYRLADATQPEDVGGLISDSVELLHHLYRIEEDSHCKNDLKCIESIEIYTETVKPDESITKLKNRLLDTLEQVKTLQGQVEELKPCKRCAAIDARIASRSAAVGM